jgi:hypothetical protein
MRRPWNTFSIVVPPMLIFGIMPLNIYRELIEIQAVSQTQSEIGDEDPTNAKFSIGSGNSYQDS